MYKDLVTINFPQDLNFLAYEGIWKELWQIETLHDNYPSFADGFDIVPPLHAWMLFPEIVINMIKTFPIEMFHVITFVNINRFVHLTRAEVAKINLAMMAEILCAGADGFGLH